LIIVIIYRACTVSQNGLEVCRQFITTFHCISCTDNESICTLSISLIRIHDDCSWYIICCRRCASVFMSCWLLFYKFAFKSNNNNNNNNMVIIWMAEWRNVTCVVSRRLVPAWYLKLSRFVCILLIRILVLVLHSDWLVCLCTFVHFSLDSNLQLFCNYAIKHLE